MPAWGLSQKDTPMPSLGRGEAFKPFWILITRSAPWEPRQRAFVLNFLNKVYPPVCSTLASRHRCTCKIGIFTTFFYLTCLSTGVVDRWKEMQWSVDIRYMEFQRYEAMDACLSKRGIALSFCITNFPKVAKSQCYVGVCAGLEKQARNLCDGA